MATLGNVPAEAYTNTVKDSFNGNGSATAFTMSLPTVTNDVRVVVENVIQDPTVAYSVSGTTLTFTSAPPSGTNNIYVVHLGPAVMTTVPPAEIADATTFASSLTVQGAFTSPGIDDNADAVALTIDSSENVMLGVTTPYTSPTSSTNDGVAFAGSYTWTQVSDAGGQYVQRQNDGKFFTFHKGTASTPVGSIGANGTASWIACPAGSGAGLRFDGSDNRIVPTEGDGTNRDAAVDLGYSSSRFQNLYLSGGILLGGTVSANKLDDVETGSFTPVVSGLTFTTATGTYVKVGKACHISINLNTSNTSTSGDIYITGLPFTSPSNNYGANSVPFMEAANISLAGGYSNMYGRINTSDTRLQLLQSSGTAHSGMSAGGGLSTGAVLRTSFTYQTT